MWQILKVNMSRSSNVYAYNFVVNYLKLTWPRIGWVYISTYIDLILSKNAIWYVSLELSYKYILAASCHVIDHDALAKINWY